MFCVSSEKSLIRQVAEEKCIKYATVDTKEKRGRKGTGQNGKYVQRNDGNIPQKKLSDKNQRREKIGQTDNPRLQ